MTVSHCRAKDPTTCKYHGAEIRAEKALRNGDGSGYMAARREMDANRDLGREEEKTFLPKPEEATVADLYNDRDRLIMDYPTESTLESTWTEDGAYDHYGDPETNTFSRYTVTGNLAQRILTKAGKADGVVELTESREPYWLGEMTSDVDYNFYVEVDGVKVWDTREAGKYVSSDFVPGDQSDSFSLTYVGLLNEWLNS